MIRLPHAVPDGTPPGERNDRFFLAARRTATTVLCGLVRRRERGTSLRHAHRVTMIPGETIRPGASDANTSTAAARPPPDSPPAFAAMPK